MPCRTKLLLTAPGLVGWKGWGEGAANLLKRRFPGKSLMQSTRQHNARQGLRWEQCTSLEDWEEKCNISLLWQLPLASPWSAEERLHGPGSGSVCSRLLSVLRGGPCFTPAVLCCVCLCFPVSCFDPPPRLLGIPALLQIAGTEASPQKVAQVGNDRPQLLPPQLTAFCYFLGINQGNLFLLKGF